MVNPPQETQEQKLPPYALILAEVVDRKGSDVLVAIYGPKGEPEHIWVEDSAVAPLSRSEAEQMAETWNIGLR